VPGSNRKRSPKRSPGERYDTASYGTAIDNLCDAAFPPPGVLAKKESETNEQWQARLTREHKSELKRWRKERRWSPNQLRHARATDLRRRYGIDTAQTILGHRLGSHITEVYAEGAIADAIEIMSRIG
jgi:integrase